MTGTDAPGADVPTFGFDFAKIRAHARDEFARGECARVDYLLAVRGAYVASGAFESYHRNETLRAQLGPQFAQFFPQGVPPAEWLATIDREIEVAREACARYRRAVDAAWEEHYGFDPFDMIERPMLELPDGERMRCEEPEDVVRAMLKIETEDDCQFLTIWLNGEERQILDRRPYPLAYREAAAARRRLAEAKIAARVGTVRALTRWESAEQPESKATATNVLDELLVGDHFEPLRAWLRNLDSEGGRYIWPRSGWESNRPGGYDGDLKNLGGLVAHLWTNHLGAPLIEFVRQYKRPALACFTREAGLDTEQIKGAVAVFRRPGNLHFDGERGIELERAIAACRAKRSA